MTYKYVIRTIAHIITFTVALTVHPEHLSMITKALCNNHQCGNRVKIQKVKLFEQKTDFVLCYLYCLYSCHSHRSDSEQHTKIKKEKQNIIYHASFELHDRKSFGCLSFAFCPKQKIYILYIMEEQDIMQLLNFC